MTYQGIVRMAINALVFAPDYSSCNYNIDTTKVNRLKHIFELEGCNRYDPQNFIRGSITRDALQKALVRSRLTLASLQREGDPPMLHLPPDTYVRCDQGRSRVKALLDTDRSFYWWTVELYADIHQEAPGRARNTSVNIGGYSDGRICAEIVQSRFNTIAEDEWWAKLSKSKASILRGLLEHHSLATPFVELIRSIPAMREDLLIGVWHKIIAAKCDEEIIRYFRFILNTWTEIMGSKSALRHIDTASVRELQLRVPGLSEQDLEHVTRVITSGVVFRSLTNTSERVALLDRLRRIKFLIPSIHTLQKDVKYLRPCADVLKRLILGQGRSSSTAQAVALDAFLPGRQRGADAEFLDKLKRVYLFIMQNIVQLTDEAPLRGDRAKVQMPGRGGPNPKSWFQLAIEAQRLGFSSVEITRLASEDPDRELALRTLLLARPESEYEYDRSDLDNLVSSAVQLFRAARRRRPDFVEPRFTTRGTGELIARRCGRQYSGAYEHDRNFFTMTYFSLPVARDVDVTSLFVRRSVFHAFFRLEKGNKVTSDATGVDQSHSPAVMDGESPQANQDRSLSKIKNEETARQSVWEALRRQDEALQQGVAKQYGTDVGGSLQCDSKNIVEISSDSCESTSETEDSEVTLEPALKRRRRG
ncbi:hypothetical protein BKA60DRAFT_579738 [Fusarium oxysporum]|nr:hypothetical protein BKA60DRAFT_579738 [Fusarium oxysporum]